MKDLRYVYKTAILSAFLIKIIRATERLFIFWTSKNKLCFLFKILFWIFKEMKNASVSLNFEWTKEKTDRKSIFFSTKESILLSLN